MPANFVTEVFTVTDFDALDGGGAGMGKEAKNKNDFTYT